jgi:hypothetical protein
MPAFPATESLPASLRQRAEGWADRIYQRREEEAGRFGLTSQRSPGLFGWLINRTYRDPSLSLRQRRERAGTPEEGSRGRRGR